MLSRVACALARRAPKGARGMGGSAGPADAGRAVTYEGVTVQDADPTMKTIAVILGTTMWSWVGYKFYHNYDVSFQNNMHFFHLPENHDH